MFDFSPIQIIIVLVIALAVFGPKRLPEMGRSLGRGLREFKGSITGSGNDDRDERDEYKAEPVTTAGPSLTKTSARDEDDERDEVLVGATPATNAKA